MYGSTDGSGQTQCDISQNDVLETVCQFFTFALFCGYCGYGPIMAIVDLLMERG